jgi:hypothetical protein
MQLLEVSRKETGGNPGGLEALLAVPVAEWTQKGV